MMSMVALISTLSAFEMHQGIAMLEKTPSSDYLGMNSSSDCALNCRWMLWYLLLAPGLIIG